MENICSEKKGGKNDGVFQFLGQIRKLKKKIKQSFT